MPGGVNPSNDLRLFQNIGQRPDDRMIFAGTRDGGTFRSVRNNAFGRVAVWVRKTFGTDHRNSVDQAYARFSGAIHSHAHAGAQELARADALLDADRRAGKPLSSRTVGQVFSELETQDAVASGAGLEALKQYELLAAARRGIDGARTNLAEICSDLNSANSAEDCLRMLRSGDGGLRRGTTALHNIQSTLKPENLPPEALVGTTEQWRTQSARVTGMAGQLASACFNDDLGANFTQYGNSDNPFSKVVADFPVLDRPVRIWLTEGLDLADKLLQAQERAGQGQPPLDAEELDGLQRRVDAFADSAARLTPQDWSEQVLTAALGKNHGLTSGVAPLPTTGPAPTGGSLAPNVDRAGAIARLEQDIALQQQEVDRLAQAGAGPEVLGRARAELDARVLSCDELTRGRDPCDALRLRRDELAAQYGATDPRVSAYDDTVDFFSAAPAFGEVGVDTDRVPDFVDTSRILAEWRQRSEDTEVRGEMLQPRSGAERERAEAFEDVSAFMKQAIVNVAARRDPRPELISHAVVLERQTFADGGTGAGEATMLRAMEKEYALLLEASQARHDAARGP